MSFFQELKHRNVFRVAIAYLLAAWLVLQVADTVAPILDLPEIFTKSVLLLLAIGFPISMVFSWAFELTADGIRKEKNVDRSASIAHQTGRNLDFVIIGVLSAAVVMFALDKFVWTNSVDSSSAQQTIAVLPFENISDDSEQEYFSDGLSEELLNLLAQIPELRVSSRTSSFSFKDSNPTISEVGRTLNVDHVLDGSVRRSGNTIRVTAQLSDVSTDAQVWSATWDRTFADVFVIQDEIAASVVDALKIELLSDVPHALETTSEAYDLYLQAKFLIDQGVPESFRQAEEINQRILEIDPGYVPAWTQRAWLYYQGAAFGGWEPKYGIPRAREAALESIRLFDNTAGAHAILAYIAIDYDYDYTTAEKELEKALKLGPDDAFVLRAGAEYETRKGNLVATAELLERARAIDPLTGSGASLAIAYMHTGRQAEGIALWKKAVERRPFGEWYRRSLALALLEIGDVEAALATIDKEPSEGYRNQGLAIIYESIGEREKSTEALNKLSVEGQRWTWELTEVHSYRGELDEAFKWIDRAIERRDRGLRHVMYSPYLENMRADPRFENVLIRIGLSPKS